MSVDKNQFDEVVEEREQLEDQLMEEQARAWVVTFADLSLLLLVFFILLFSMSNLDLEQFTDSFTAVKEALLGKDAELATFRVQRKEAGVILDQVKMQRQIMESQKKVYSQMQFFQNTKGLEGVVGAYFDKGIITLRVPSDVMFPSGQVELTPRGQQVIRQLKDFFIQHPDQNINIRGFTDDVRPRAGARFKDNWEISALRAVNVLRFLLNQGLDANRLTATGLADMEPLFPNNSPENRAKNRRIEFVLEKRVGR
jgi:chemotaxis protein MotB